MIVLADQMGASVGDLYEGALIPGLSLAALYAEIEGFDPAELRASVGFAT